MIGNNGEFMKKIFILMFFISSSFAFSATNRLGIGYADVQFDDIDVDLDGWSISYDGAVTDNILIGADYTSLSGDADLDLSLLSFAYGFGDLSEGAFTVGFTRFDSDVASADTDLEVGYSRRGGDGVDFSISAIATEEDTTFRARIFTPVGINLGYLTDGDVGIFNIGYMWKF
jgi:hypothetical protein